MGGDPEIPLWERIMNENSEQGDEPSNEILPPSRSEKSPITRMRPVPPVFKDISANGCKTTKCENFAVAPME